jgi:hypothetical protein
VGRGDRGVRVFGEQQITGVFLKPAIRVILSKETYETVGIIILIE